MLYITRQKLSVFVKSIFVKFVLMFIVVGLIPIMGMSYLVFEKVPELLESYMVANYVEVLKYAGKNIELEISSYDQITRTIYEYGRADNDTVADAIRGQDYFDLPSYSEKLIEEYMRSLLYSDQYLESVFLLDSEYEVFKYFSKSASYYFENIEMSTFNKFSKIFNDNRALTILPTHNEEYFNKSDKMVLTFARNYLDVNYLPDREVVAATLMIDVNLDFVDEIIKRMNLDENGKIFIVDTEGYNIYDSDRDYETDAYSLYVQNSNNIQDQLSGYLLKEDNFLFYQHIENTDWIMLYKVEKSNIMRLIDDLKSITTFLLIVIIITLIFIAITFSKNLSKPLKNIIEQMKVVSDGDFSTQVKVKGTYEVTQLAAAFNQMTERLKSYINQAYGAKIKQREAELNGIKAQIRPHYLYNTLEIIRMSALEEDATETKEMIVSLSEQLKYVIGQYGDCVSLGMELDMIKNYFKIIKVRYEGRIALEIDVPKEFYDYKVLKLILQPLVENAVIHGVKLKKSKGKIKVSAKLIENVLELQVIDDGVGMSENSVQEIRALLNSDKMGKELDGNWEKIGLKNVHDRIQMNYGESFGLSISSKEKLGTRMSIRIPVE